MCVLLVCCAVCCVVAGSGQYWLISQHPCVIAGSSCNGLLHPLTEHEAQLVRERCLADGRQHANAAVICKRHFNELLQRYKPTRCAACPTPLSASGSMPYPEWMREQLCAHHGSFVHVRPCYKAAVAAKKRQAADTQPMEVEQENIAPPPTFQVDVSQHTNKSSGSRTHTAHSHTLSLCTGRLRWRKPLAAISGARRCSRAD